MPGARHATRPVRGPVHRLANLLCCAVVVVGVAAVLLGGRASGYAAGPGGVVLAAGPAVVPGGLHPGAVTAGSLPVRNDSPYDASVTRVEFYELRPDAAHAGCGARDLVIAVAGLPRVPAKTARAIPFTLSMSPAAADACQGATFTSGYRVTARPV